LQKRSFSKKTFVWHKSVRLAQKRSFGTKTFVWAKTLVWHKTVRLSQKRSKCSNFLLHFLLHQKQHFCSLNCIFAVKTAVLQLKPQFCSENQFCNENNTFVAFCTKAFVWHKNVRLAKKRSFATKAFV
jgi:hypothetical protein